MNRIKATVVRANNYGLVVIQDTDTGRQYAVTSERVKTLPAEAPWKRGTPVEAALQGDVVVEAHKATAN